MTKTKKRVLLAFLGLCLTVAGCIAFWPRIAFALFLVIPSGDGYSKETLWIDAARHSDWFRRKLAEYVANAKRPARKVWFAGDFLIVGSPDEELSASVKPALIAFVESARANDWSLKEMELYTLSVHKWSVWLLSRGRPDISAELWRLVLEIPSLRNQLPRVHAKIELEILDKYSESPDTP